MSTRRQKGRDRATSHRPAWVRVVIVTRGAHGKGFSGEGGRGGSGVRWDSPCHTVRTKSQCLRCMLYLRL